MKLTQARVVGVRRNSEALVGVPSSFRPRRAFGADSAKENLRRPRQARYDMRSGPFDRDPQGFDASIMVARPRGASKWQERIADNDPLTVLLCLLRKVFARHQLATP